MPAEWTSCVAIHIIHIDNLFKFESVLTHSGYTHTKLNSLDPHCLFHFRKAQAMRKKS